MPKKKSRRAPSGPTTAKRKVAGRPTKKAAKRKPSKKATVASGRKAQKEFDGTGTTDMEKDFYKTVKTMHKSWNEAKKKKISGIYEPPDIPAGTYLTRITDCSVQRFGAEGAFFLETKFVINGGSHADVELRSILGMTEEPAFGEFLRIDLVLDHLRKLGIDVEAAGPGDVWNLAAQVAEDQLYVRVGVKNRIVGEGADKKRYQDVRVQKILTDEEVAF